MVLIALLGFFILRACTHSRAAREAGHDHPVRGGAPQLAGGTSGRVPASLDLTIEGSNASKTPIDGRVVDAHTFEPVAGAELRVRPYAPDRTQEDVRVYYSGSDGRFQIPGFHDCVIRAKARGYAESFGLCNDTIISMEHGVRVHGRILDEFTGRPVRNARVACGLSDDADLEPLPVATSDTSGEFDVSGCPDSPTIVVRHPDYAFFRTFEITAPPGSDVHRDFEIRPGVMVSGRVLDADGGPAPDALVALFEGRASEYARPVVTATVAADGTFELGPIEVGSHTVAAHIPGTDAEVVTRIQVPGPPTVLTMPTLRDVSVTVELDGEPVPGAHVAFCADDPPDGLRTPRVIGSPCLRRTTDANGVAEAIDASMGPYRVSAYSDWGRGATTLGVGVEHASISLTRGARIEVHVLDEFHQPVPHVSITAKRVSGGKSETGVHSSLGVSVISAPEGEYDVGPLRYQPCPGTEPIRVSVRAGESKHVTLRCVRGGVVHGRVVWGATQRPVHGAKISFKPANTTIFEYFIDTDTYTDRNGEFDLSGPLGRGRLQVILVTSLDESVKLDPELVTTPTAEEYQFGGWEDYTDTPGYFRLVALEETITVRPDVSYNAGVLTIEPRETTEPDDGGASDFDDFEREFDDFDGFFETGDSEPSP